MANPRLEALVDEVTKARTAIETLDRTASEEGRDLTSAETADADVLYARIAEITKDDGELVKLRTQADTMAAAADVISRINVTGESAARTNPVLGDGDRITPGEYIFAYMRAHNSFKGNDGNRRKPTSEDVSRFEVLSRTLTRAGTLQHQAEADNPGLIPTFIVGDLVKFVYAQRPAVNSSRQLPMPSKGKTFTRPRNTQQSQVAVQDGEGAVLASRKFLVTGDTVTKGTYGGVLNISEDDIDDTEPALLDLAIQDLAEQYAIETDAATAAAIEAAIESNTVSLSLTAPSDEFIAAVAEASGAVFAQSKNLPDTLYASVDRWAYMIGLVDDDGRQIFPNLAPVNAPGTSDATSFAGNPFGFKLVVDPNFSDGTFIVAASKFVETYENVKGLATLQAPSVLETQVAYRGRFATNVYCQGLSSLVAP